MPSTHPFPTFGLPFTCCMLCTMYDDVDNNNPPKIFHLQFIHSQYTHHRNPKNTADASNQKQYRISLSSRLNSFLAVETRDLSRFFHSLRPPPPLPRTQHSILESSLAIKFLFTAAHSQDAMTEKTVWRWRRGKAGNRKVFPSCRTRFRYVVVRIAMEPCLVENFTVFDVLGDFDIDSILTGHVDEKWGRIFGEISSKFIGIQFWIKFVISKHPKILIFFIILCPDNKWTKLRNFNFLD